MGLVLVQTFFEFLLVFLGIWTFESGLQRKMLSAFMWFTNAFLMIGKQFWIQELPGGTIQAITVSYPTRIAQPFAIVFILIGFIILINALTDVLAFRSKKAKILKEALQ